MGTQFPNTHWPAWIGQCYSDELNTWVEDRIVFCVIDLRPRAESGDPFQLLKLRVSSRIYIAKLQAPKSRCGLPAIRLSAIGRALYSQSQGPNDAKKQIVAELRAGDFSGAEAPLREALKSSRSDVSLWVLNGYALLHLQKPKEALASYERALEIAPDYVAALEGAAEIDFAAGDQRAAPLLERLPKIHPDDETAHRMLAALA